MAAGKGALIVERPDEISVIAASTLLGITERRYRQLAAQGFCTIHARGKTTVGSAVSGYVRSLRAEAEASPTTATAARAHTAKAQLVRSFTAKRRAALTVRAEAEAVVEEIATAAIRRLRDARLPASIPAATGQSFRAEIAAARSRIETAKTVALEALRTGDMALLDGAAHG